MFRYVETLGCGLGRPTWLLWAGAPSYYRGIHRPTLGRSSRSPVVLGAAVPSSDGVRDAERLVAGAVKTSASDRIQDLKLGIYHTNLTAQEDPHLHYMVTVINYVTRFLFLGSKCYFLIAYI